MSRIVYVNGAYVPESDAKVSVFDRGFLMADGVYEVTSVLDGRIVDFDGHARRLARSLSELDMACPVDDAELLTIHKELVARNGVDEGMVYLQITRGAPAERDFAFPDPATVPSTIVLFTQSKPGLADSPLAKKGMRVISIPDARWGRRDIKTVQLLYPSLGKMMAKKAGVDDAWMVEDGVVTEGTSNNAYIVKDGTIVTRNWATKSLPGSPATPSCALPTRRRCGSRNAPSPSPRRRPRTRLSSPRPRPSSCPWWKLTVQPSAPAPPAPSRDACGKSILRRAARPRSDRSAGTCHAAKDGHNMRRS